MDLFGSLSTDEVKALLDTVITYDSDDLEISTTRNEIKIKQRIGNIVSHQTEKIVTYKEGFIVDKNYNPAMFFAITGFDSNIKPIEKQIIEKRRKQATEILKRRNAHKYDWNKINAKRIALGKAGEIFAFDFEKDIVSGINANSVDRVIHLSIQAGDGLGYDIISVDDKGNSKYIEVKTTTGNYEDGFYMSKNERDFFTEHQKDNDAFIYRVYQFNEISNHGEIKIISADELLTNYKFDPTTFLVTLK